MTRSKLDHIAVAAVDLESGRQYLEDLLGVETSPGGRHEAIGTHNRLLRLGEDQYLEVIALDPEGVTPDHPRWFGFDDPGTQSRLRESPGLLAWVARTDDIEAASALPAYRGVTLRDMTRGDLRWRMSFTPDGNLLDRGALPLLIQWQTDTLPPARLPDAGCALKRFVIQSPDARQVQETLRDMNLPDVEVEQAEQTILSATISTPARGDVVLTSAPV